MNRKTEVRRTICALVLSLAALALIAAPASAAPPTPTMGSVNEITGSTAHMTGTVDIGTSEGYWSFETSTDGVNWSGFAYQGYFPAESGPTPVDFTVGGLKGGTKYFARLTALAEGEVHSAGPDPEFTTAAVTPPTVVLADPSAITSDAAHLSGTVNPNGTIKGHETSWRFECTPECPGISGGELAAGTTPQTVEVDATGLKTNTGYSVKLIAFNSGGESVTAEKQFTTSASVPTSVATLAAFAPVGGTTALLGGAVNPENDPTEFWFEYGEDETYGQVFPPNEDGDAGSGEAIAYRSVEIDDLTPGATYHFRFVTRNATGTVAGTDETFTTPTGNLGTSLGQLVLPDNRRWEMVSPPDKNRADVWKVYGVATPDGDGITYKSQGSFAGLPTAKGGNLADYRAVRGPGTAGWQSRGLTPSGGLFCFVCGAIEFDEDLNYAYFNWRERKRESPDKELPVDPNSLEEITRGYLRDNTTNTFKRIPNSGSAFVRSSSDGSHVALATRENLTNQAPCNTLEADPNGPLCVYETLDLGHSWRLASILPNETPVDANVAAISRDGSRIYFNSAGKNYVRIDGEETVELPGEGGTSVAAVEGRVGDGSRVLLRSNEPLVTEDEDLSDDFYLWDGSQPAGDSLKLLTQGDIPGTEADLVGLLGFERDARWVHDLDRGFFTTNNQILAGEPTLPGAKIYQWEIEAGQVSLSYVATLNNTSEPRTSQNNRFLVFPSTDRLSGYDNEGRQEVYRYDGGTDQLACVSCNPENRKPTADDRLYIILSPEGAFGADHALRNVSDDGEVFFESLEGLAKHDANGEYDVYQYTDGLPHLLSKGTGPMESRFFDASADGDDVFFITSDQLVGWDTDHSFDIYDARAGGGLPEPPAKGIPCEGDSCQPLPNPPNDPTPASENFNGAGNVPPPAKCKKGKVRKGGKCVKKHKKKHKKKKTTRKNG